MEKIKIDKVTKNIAGMRLQRGYTYENMADELSISPAAYRKIETGETKLTLERLLRISEILSAPLLDLMEMNSDLQYADFDNDTKRQRVDSFFRGSRDIYEKLIQSKDEQIALLKSMLGQPVNII